MICFITKFISRRNFSEDTSNRLSGMKQWSDKYLNYFAYKKTQAMVMNGQQKKNRSLLMKSFDYYRFEEVMVCFGDIYIRTVDTVALFSVGKIQNC